MSRNKVLIGSDESQYVAAADSATRSRDTARAEVTMIRRRIRTFFSAITQVRFPDNPPAWAEDWPQWLETGEIPVEEVEETPVDADAEADAEAEEAAEEASEVIPTL